MEKKSELTDRFLNDFNGRKAELRSKLDGLQPSTDQDERVQKQLDELMGDFEKLKIFISENSAILPAYHARSTQETLKALLGEIENKKSQMKPRKKFAFAKSSNAKSTVEKKPIVNDEVDRQVAAEKAASLIEFTGLRDRAAESLVLTSEESTLKDLQLINLTHCKVQILGQPNTIYLKSIVDCEITMAPVKTSIFIDDCKRSTFHCSSQQLRIHTSLECDFYVLTTSKPIIEDCQKVRFGRYAISSLEGGDPKLDSSASYWDQVIDFNWLSTDKPSPNWSVIES